MPAPPDSERSIGSRHPELAGHPGRRVLRPGAGTPGSEGRVCKCVR